MRKEHVKQFVKAKLQKKLLKINVYKRNISFLKYGDAMVLLA